MQQVVVQALSTVQNKKKLNDGEGGGWETGVLGGAQEGNASKEK